MNCFGVYITYYVLQFLTKFFSAFHPELGAILCGHKVFIVLIYTIVALAVFLWDGQVDLQLGLTLAIGNMIGGYVASILSVEKGASWVRVLLIVIALASSLKLLGIF